MIVGLDIGGTKIEAQVFDADWTEVARLRRPTPADYDGLVAAVAGVIEEAQAETAPFEAIGIGAAGLIHPDTGLATTANLPAMGRPLPGDIAARLGRNVTYVNDCRALALSESVFGAGKGKRCVVALIIGTGIGGGIAINDRLLQGPTLTGGEFGHIAAPAHLIAAHGLPVEQCGCGRMACIETYVSGPGMARLAKHLTGKDVTPPEIAARRDGDMAQVWDIWCALAGEMLLGLTLTVDPDVIVLGGGLSRIEGVTQALEDATRAAQIGAFNVPPVVLASGGDSSGARGAAYAAWQECGA
ncbi:ROK family protein [Shimia abyssi]|uniref:N-acetylglucosamine kinase n=1 Tax=Shimia abyssi TaxID=1662395 RepID=A0A2P8FDH7_9RHOB|nr:ROK family protein [Shimia abyssi]PSL19767.1 N-acetylglucosamine kinase [Shimia abyssi]